MSSAEPTPPRLSSFLSVSSAKLRDSACDVERQRVVGGHEDDVARQVLGGEDVGVREDLGERAQDDLDVLRGHLVQLRPLAEDAVVGEAAARQLPVVDREQVRHAGDPRVRRLGDDDVVLVGRLRQKVAPVADDDVNPRVLRRMVVPRAEVVGAGVDHRRLELDDVGVGDGELRDRADGHARAEADDRGARPLVARSARAGCAAFQKTNGMRPTMICVAMSSPFEASTLPLFLSATVCDQCSTQTVVAMPS